MIIHGRIPVVPTAPETGRTRARRRLQQFLARLPGPWRERAADPAIAAYLGAYEAVFRRMLPDRPLAKLERLHADLYDGRIRPSAAYCTLVKTAATVLNHHLAGAAELLAVMHPPPAARPAFRRLFGLHETAQHATNAVLAAADRGDIDTLRDAVFRLTCEVTMLQRSIEAEHERLRSDAPAPARPSLGAAPELPANVIPLVRARERIQQRISQRR